MIIYLLDQLIVLTFWCILFSKSIFLLVLNRLLCKGSLIFHRKKEKNYLRRGQGFVL